MMRVAIPIILVAVATTASAAEIETTWSALPTLVAGKQASVELVHGGSVAGRVVAVHSTGLRMKIDRSSEARFSANSEHDIPRPEVIRLTVTGTGAAGRIVGTVAGIAGGFVLGGAIFDKPGDISRALRGAVGGAVAGAVGGYWLGGRIDRRRTVIRTVP